MSTGTRGPRCCTPPQQATSASCARCSRQVTCNEWLHGVVPGGWAAGQREVRWQCLLHSPFSAWHGAAAVPCSARSTTLGSHRAAAWHLPLSSPSCPPACVSCCPAGRSLAGPAGRAGTERAHRGCASRPSSGRGSAAGGWGRPQSCRCAAHTAVWHSDGAQHAAQDGCLQLHLGPAQLACLRTDYNLQAPAETSFDSLRPLPQTRLAQRPFGTAASSMRWIAYQVRHAGGYCAVPQLLGAGQRTLHLLPQGQPAQAARLCDWLWREPCCAALQAAAHHALLPHLNRCSAGPAWGGCVPCRPPDKR